MSFWDPQQESSSQQVWAGPGTAPLCQDRAQGPQLSAQPRRLGLRPPSHWVFPTTSTFIQESWEAGGQEGGNRTEKQERGKETKAQPEARRGTRASGHALGQGLSCTSRRLSVHQGGGENDHPLRYNCIGHFKYQKQWLTATGCYS